MAEPRGEEAVRSARIDTSWEFLTAHHGRWRLRSSGSGMRPATRYLKSARIGTVDVVAQGLQLESAGSATFNDHNLGGRR